MDTTLAQYYIQAAPFYSPQASEVALFNSAYAQKLPVLLKGPTGCGKSRFMEYMAWQLNRPLITIACHDDLTASDLLGRYLIKDGQTIWCDGPLTLAARFGAICYLDEVVEARKDTTVVIHPLTDHRRVLPIEKTGELIHAHPNFFLAISYNPGYQSVLKELKQSTRQRFVSLEFDYPSADIESQIVATESGIDVQMAKLLVRYAHMTRNLKGNGLEEGASTRLLVHAAKLIVAGIDMQSACRHGIAQTLTDDPDTLQGLYELGASIF